MNSKPPFLPELWRSVKAKLSANSPSLIRGRGGRVGSIFCPQWNLSFGTAPFEGHKIWSRKNVHIVFVFVVLYWRDSFIQGKGTLFLGPETRLWPPSRGHLITQKVTESLKTQGNNVTIVRSFKPWTIPPKPMYCTCENSTHNIAEMS